MARGVFKGRRSLVDVVGPSSEPFRGLRLAVELRPDVRRGNAIVFTSPNPGDGKSTVAANFALVAAISHGRVLLVDGDLRSPSLHEFFEVPRAPGLGDVIRDGMTLSQATRRIEFPASLDLLTAGSPLPRAADIAASRPMTELLEHARNEYELVVIDSPPVLAAADAAALASNPGTDVILVVKGTGRRRPVTNTVRKLELTGANVLGLVLNREGQLTPYNY